MKYKSLILMAVLVMAANAFSTTYIVWTPITDVNITSHSNCNIVFAGSTINLTCTTSTDTDCFYPDGDLISDSVTHYWQSASGSFSPSTGTSVSWTAPSTTGEVAITVTADDNYGSDPAYYDDAAVSDAVTLRVQNIIYVDGDATGDDNGTSWANAFTDLQDALDVANSGNQIWVAEGTYKPTKLRDPNDVRSATFELAEGVIMYGGFDPSVGDDEWWERYLFSNRTILSGDIGTVNDSSDNAYQVVVLDSDITIDGFEISDGSSDDDYVTGYAYGSAIYVKTGSEDVTIQYCKICDNDTDGYGNGAVEASYCDNVAVINCFFEDNDIERAFRAFYGSGAIEKCRFIGNNGAVELQCSDYTIHNCAFYDNSAMVGGAMLIFSQSNIEQCIFVDNIAGQGGALFVPGGPNGTHTVSNCTFVGNSSVIYAGHTDGIDMTVKNSVIVGSSSGYDVYLGDWEPVVRFYNCDMYNVSTYRFSGTLTQTNCIYTDPLLVNSTDLDGADDIWMTYDDGLELDPNSPCIDAGVNNAIGGPYDIVGKDRTIDGDGDQTDTVDMGAYEYDPS